MMMMNFYTHSLHELGKIFGVCEYHLLSATLLPILNEMESQVSLNYQNLIIGNELYLVRIRL